MRAFGILRAGIVAGLLSLGSGTVFGGMIGASDCVGGHCPGVLDPFNDGDFQFDGDGGRRDSPGALTITDFAAFPTGDGKNDPGETSAILPLRTGPTVFTAAVFMPGPSVPEPGTYVLIGMGLTALALIRRRK